jgi:hypothetical protein
MTEDFCIYMQSLELENAPLDFSPMWDPVGRTKNGRLA